MDTEDVGDERVLLISGFPVQVCKAKAAIHQILTENSPVSEQLSVPQRSVGRIIGTTGQLPLLFPFFLYLCLPFTPSQGFLLAYLPCTLPGKRKGPGERPELYFLTELLVKQKL